MKKSYSRVFVISDMHIPYHHVDLIPFLKAVKKHLKPDKVVCTGDEIDFHSMSFHDKDPELFSPSMELEEAKDYLKNVFKIFPEVDVLESNHGSLVYRKGKFHGIPRSVLKSYNDVLEAPVGWKWHNELIVPLAGGSSCYFTHGKSANGLKLSQNMGMCVVQGHFHSKFDIQYWANPNALYWAMTVGCMIDDSSLAFAYNKSTLQRPLIGCGIILDGQPKLLPMILDKNGRWPGKLV
jgi:hypothetical protein